MKRSMIPWKRKRKDAQLTQTSENPFAELYQRMNGLFAEFFEDRGDLLPSQAASGGGNLLSMPTFDVAETDKEIEVRAELPGLDEKDIEVTLDNNILTISGEKRQEHSENKKNYYLSECRYGSFQRAVPLPAGIEQDKAKAAFKKGVLRITLPKSPEARSARNRIAIDTD